MEAKKKDLCKIGTEQNTQTKFRERKSKIGKGVCTGERWLRFGCFAQRALSVYVLVQTGRRDAV